MNKFIVDKLLKEIEEKITADSERICAGGLSFDGYKHMCGRVNAFKEVLLDYSEILEEHNRKITKQEEDD